MNHATTSFFRAIGLTVLVTMIGCGKRTGPPAEPASPSTDQLKPVASSAITLATTTSTQDSGLLDILVPAFRDATGVSVKVVAVGSGQAIELGRRGDADVLLTHAPDAEQKFLDDGFAIHRYSLMANEFVIVGPPTDPAGIEGSTALDAFKKIAAANALFVSRADKSGTHVKEQSLWKQAGIEPNSDWYLKAGAGMAETMRVANEKGAYTLSDRATYLAQRTKLDLKVVSASDPLLLNPYAVLQINAGVHPKLNHEAAARFIEFLFSPAAQEMIATFGQDRFGQPLFVLPEDEQGETMPTPIVLPADPTSPVISLDRIASSPAQEPVLVVYSGRMAAASDPAANSKQLAATLSPDELQQLLHFILQENAFFDISPATIESQWNERKKADTESSGTNTLSTVIRIRTSLRKHEVRFDNLEQASADYPKIRQLQQLLAIERRLLSLAEHIRTGGTGAQAEPERVTSTDQ